MLCVCGNEQDISWAEGVGSVIYQKNSGTSHHHVELILRVLGLIVVASGSEDNHCHVQRLSCPRHLPPKQAWKGVATAIVHPWEYPDFCVLNVRGRSFPSFARVSARRSRLSRGGLLQRCQFPHLAGVSRKWGCSSCSRGAICVSGTGAP